MSTLVGGNAAIPECDDYPVCGCTPPAPAREIEAQQAKNSGEAISERYSSMLNIKPWISSILRAMKRFSFRVACNYAERRSKVWRRCVLVSVATLSASRCTSRSLEAC